MADDAITSFKDEYAFLSNFYAHPIEIDGDTYPTNEHAFQALKTDDPAERQRVGEAKTPASAKSLGKRVTLRAGWNVVRFDVMELVVRGCVLGNDGSWKRRNELGKILMRVRAGLEAGG